ncbi:hypothetical protein EC988_009965, partial [Linderina pennispora]
MQARQIDHEVREEQAQLTRLNETRKRHAARVSELIDRVIRSFMHDWDCKETHALSIQGHRLWGQYINLRDKLEKDLEDLRSRRLPKLRQTYIDSGTTGEKALLKLCEGMRPTVYSIKEKEWLLVLTSLPNAPQRLKPTRSPSAEARLAKAKRRRLAKSAQISAVDGDAGADADADA